MKKGIILIIPVLFFLNNCVDRSLARVQPKTSTYEAKSIYQAEIPKVDILVVVDNSESMREEQTNLVNNFPALIRELVSPTLDPEANPVQDMHIGVVSTDLGTGPYRIDNRCTEHGDDGILQNEPSSLIPECANRGPFPQIISYSNGLPAVDELAEQFKCIAALGIDGCGIEQPLEAAKRALIDQAGPGKPNEGFLRDDAILAIIFVTDENDCSLKDYSLLSSEIPDPMNIRCFLPQYQDYLYSVDYYEEQIKSLKADPDNQIVIAVIAGVPINWDKSLQSLIDMQRVDDTGEKMIPSCETALGKAYPPVRLVDFAYRFGENQTVQSICVQDWRPAMLAITRKIQGLISYTCLERGVDIEKGCDVVVRAKDYTCDDLNELAEDGSIYSFIKTEIDEKTNEEINVCRMQRADFVDTNGNHIYDEEEEELIREGWYYIPAEYTEGKCEGKHEIRFTPKAVPPSNTRINIVCATNLCPSNRVCPNATKYVENGCCLEGYHCGYSSDGVSQQCVPDRSW